MHDQHTVRHAEHFFKVTGDKQHRDSLMCELFHDAIDFGLRPDVHAACRLIHDQHLRLCGKPFCEYDFLLVPAGEVQDKLLKCRRLGRQLLVHLLGDAFFFRPIDHRAGDRAFLEAGHGRVLTDRHVQHNTLSFAVLGHECEARGDCLLGVFDRGSFSEDLNLSGKRRVNPEERCEHLGASCTDQACDADNLS